MVRKAPCKRESEILSHPVQKSFPLEIQKESEVVERVNAEEDTNEMVERNVNV